MTITQQSATRTPPARPRRPHAPLQPVPVRRRTWALARILCLMTITALGAAFIVGTVGIAIMVVASNLGG